MARNTKRDQKKPSPCTEMHITQKGPFVELSHIHGWGAENLSFQVVYVTCHGLFAPVKRFCSELCPWWFLISLSPLRQLTSNMATYVKLPYSKKKLKRYAKPLYGLNSTEWKLCTHFYRLTGHPQRITQPPRHIKTYRRRNNTTKQINHSP